MLEIENPKNLMNLELQKFLSSMNSPCRSFRRRVIVIQSPPFLPFSLPHGFLMPRNTHQYVCISSPQPLNKHFDEFGKMKNGTPTMVCMSIRSNLAIPSWFKPLMAKWAR
jgi:hypothetical protein